MAVLGGEAAQQVQAALLGDDLPGVGLLAGDVEVAGDVAVPGCPDQEGADALALVGAVAGVIGVDVGLGEGGRPHAQGGGPGQEGLGLGEPGPGVLAAVVRSGPAAALARMPGSWCHSPNWRSSRRCGCPARASSRRSSHAWNSRSCGSAAGSTPQSDQQVPQVGHGPRAGPGVQRLVGERELAGGQVREQVADVRLVQPVQRGGRAGRGGQGVGQRFQRRGDGAGPVIEQPGGRPGHRARAAEPGQRRRAAGHAGFGAAPQAARSRG